MNKKIWSGIIVWGIFVTCFGLGALNPANAVAAAPLQEIVFLLAGGLATTLVGIVGLLNAMGWTLEFFSHKAPPRSLYHLGR